MASVLSFRAEYGGGHGMQARWGMGRARALFEDQFQPSGDGFLYRKSGKGAPIAVSAEERARYVAAFAAFSRYGFWSMIGAIFALVSGETYLSQTGRPLSEFESTAAIFLVMGLFVAAHLWAWNKPVRELRGRGTAGPTPTREESLRQDFSRISYQQLALGFLFVLFLLYRYGLRENWDLRRGGIWLALAAFLTVLILVQAFRKWRFERMDRNRG